MSRSGGPLASTPSDTWLPLVSVIMPVLNEERHLTDAVARVLAQDYPGEVEIILALGPSTDRTGDVAARIAATDGRVRAVENRSGRTPEGLNAALAASKGLVIARVDGHAEIPTHYLSTAIRTLRERGADNVGGIMDAQGRTTFERAVACAMRSRLGVGSAAFHTGGEPGAADTVYLGVFRREALDRVGGYDPAFHRAQDWEMNHRIRRTGGLVWFTPDLRVTYRPRSSVVELGRQYFHYGRWRRVVARRHTGTMNFRYLAPPLMVLGTTLAAVGGAMWPPFWVVPGTYGLAILVGGVSISRGEPLRVRLTTPLALGIMHWSWGIGFLTSPPGLGGAKVSAPDGDA